MPKCQTCGGTFAATRGTPCYRRHTAAETVTLVVTLLAHGCALQAIVAAFGFDERTVANWQAKAGSHCQQVHATWCSRARSTWGTCRPTNCG